jgi:hypothetical protein
MSNSLLFGYYAISPRNLWDHGNDPYFHSKPFSWGICRPNNRSKVKHGTRLFFYTFKESARDYFLTGMMKVERTLSQPEAANDPKLYCGKEMNTCPFKIKPLESLRCPSKEELTRVETENSKTINHRDCRCNIIVNPSGEYKSFCDGGRHLHVFRKYVDHKIYFVSTVADSVATKNQIRLLDFLKTTTRFWNHSKFYGYELNDSLARRLEDVLRDNEYGRKKTNA